LELAFLDLLRSEGVSWQLWDFDFNDFLLLLTYS
jgi:hypothetical protein